jgi:hypothetical protein
MSDVYVHCRTLLFPAGNPVDGVLVSIHPSGGGDALASGVTGALPNVAGSVFLGDRAAADYEIHITPPLGAAIVSSGNLQTITVTAGQPPPVLENVVWTGAVDAVIAGNSVVAANQDLGVYSSGAYSSQTIAGNGYFDFTTNNATNQFTGISDVGSGAIDPVTFNFFLGGGATFRIRNNSATPYKNDGFGGNLYGFLDAATWAYGAGDIFRIERVIDTSANLAYIHYRKSIDAGVTFETIFTQVLDPVGAPLYAEAIGELMLHGRFSHAWPAEPFGDASNATVYDAGGSGEEQVFDVLIDVSGLPNATDIHFCRCSGTFMDSQGKPVKQLTINISENTIPELAYYAATNTANAIIPKTQIIRTDSAGHASVDLLRGATYQIYMEGFENLSRSIKVPDLTASSLPDVIFPVVDRVEYTDVNDDVLLPVDQPVLNLGVGQQAVLSLETVHRSGLRVDGLVAVTLTSDDVGGQFITLSYLDSNTLEVTAVAAGNPLLEVARIAPEEGMGISTVPEPVPRGTLSVVVV